MDEQVVAPPAKTDSVGVFVFKGQPVSSTTDVVTVAGQLLKARKLTWGDSVEVLWQEDHARYLVLYATPEKEMMEIGGRGVFVMTNGNAIVMPQM
jgi:phosphosulfolactate synthase (CoM biosynthesis protein A)